MEVTSSSISSPIILTEDEIKSICLNYFSTNTTNENGVHLKVLNYQITNIGEVPKGFLARHQYLNVLIEWNSNNVQEKLKFFVKSAPIDVKTQMDYVTDFGVFKKEVNVYQNLIPRLHDINIGISEKFSAKCLLVKQNLLVFENLTDQGYRLGAKRDGILDYDHLLSTMLTLAQMHSASLVLEHRMKRCISDMYKTCIEENAYPNNDPNNIRSIVFNKAVTAISALIEIIPKYKNSSELNFILNEFPNVMRNIFEFCKTSKRFRNVFNHGDLWANNIMYRYNESYINNPGKPINCKLVDFQLARYAPPILDVITALTIPTTSEFRQKNLKDLLENYYNYLREQLAKHELNLKDLINKKEFEQSVNYFKLAGLIESCLFSHLTLLPFELTKTLVNDSDKFNEFLMKHRSELCLEAFKTDITYQERMTDMISEIIDNYILGDQVKTTKL